MLVSLANFIVMHSGKIHAAHFFVEAKYYVYLVKRNMSIESG